MDTPGDQNFFFRYQNQHAGRRWYDNCGGCC
jgi:hypothetical protein